MEGWTHERTIDRLEAENAKLRAERDRLSSELNDTVFNLGKAREERDAALLQMSEQQKVFCNLCGLELHREGNKVFSCGDCFKRREPEKRKDEDA